MSARNAVAFEIPGPADPRAKDAGAYYFVYAYDFERRAKSDRVVGIVIACPCGCGEIPGHLWFRGGSLNGSGTDPSHEWDVAGDWPKVTMSPSIGHGTLKAGGYHWHGYLRSGVFEEC